MVMEWMPASRAVRTSARRWRMPSTADSARTNSGLMDRPIFMQRCSPFDGSCELDFGPVPASTTLDSGGQPTVRSTIEIIDAQVHLNQLVPDWQSAPADAVIASGIQAMDAVGIDRVLIGEARGFAANM